ncbi:charged multivesicular body protein [Anaeramoeba ignava]|uniref:Charged multivesicular body protein n=1 Tax=Anaeramoeba ignava TaxID=1746090 RepID=A0A9Q0LVG4_ANAIG|nr:charged multivesicular body protein [Anaeramoeba ignava]
MRKLFGSKKKKVVTDGPTLEDATKLSEKRGESLDEKIKKLDQQLSEYRAKMKKTRPGPALNSLKKRALTILKQKKMYEQQRDSLSQQTFNMEQITFTQQTLKDTVVTVNAMKSANTNLKAQFQEIDVDDVWDLKDDLGDLLEDSNEIQEALGQSFYGTEDFDEDELEAELEGLEDDMELGEENQEMPSYLEVPKEEPKINDQETEETDEYGLPMMKN